MNLKVAKMNEEVAKDILSWKYEKQYDFYNSDESDEDLKERLDGSYYVIANDQNEVVGFFCTGESAQVPMGHDFNVYQENLIDMGLGMNPHITGKGNGYEFCSFIMKHIEENHSDKVPIRLTVAKFNHRAIHLYEKLGFVIENEFITVHAEFMTMVKRDGNV